MVHGNPGMMVRIRHQAGKPSVGSYWIFIDNVAYVGMCACKYVWIKAGWKGMYLYNTSTIRMPIARE